MGSPCNYVQIDLKISAAINVAPIHSHYVLQCITNVIKDISELERHGDKSCVNSHLSLNYIPVCGDGTPTREDP